jgi:C4-type Zn-finger protein
MPELCPQCKGDFLILVRRKKSMFGKPAVDVEVYACENCGYERRKEED